MTDLISNVLDLTRLESGQVVLRRDWETLDDLAARCAARLGRARAGAPIRHRPLAGPARGARGRRAHRAGVRQPVRQRRQVHAGRNARARVGRGRRRRSSASRSMTTVPGFPAGDPELLFEKFQRGVDEPATVGVGPRPCDLPRDRACARRRHQGGAPAWRRRALRVHASGDGAGAMTDAMHQVLVVEDEPEIRRILRVLLESEKYRVVEAETAARAGDRGARAQAGPADRRPRPAGRERPRRDPRRADLVARADPRAVRPHHGGPEDRRAGRGRGRLRDETVQRAGTARAHARRAAAQREDAGAAAACLSLAPMRGRPRAPRRERARRARST